MTLVSRITSAPKHIASKIWKGLFLLPDLKTPCTLRESDKDVCFYVMLVQPATYLKIVLPSHVLYQTDFPLPLAHYR